MRAVPREKALGIRGRFGKEKKEKKGKKGRLVEVVCCQGEAMSLLLFSSLPSALLC